MLQRKRVPVADSSCPTSEEKAIAVSDVSEEYIYVATLQCTCGTEDELEVEAQSLPDADSGWMDVLHTVCPACGERYELYFDVTELFERYRPLFDLLSDEQ